jgi:plasmid stabilization system protein ParE
MGKVRWTEKASSNLQAIHDYIAKDSVVHSAREINKAVRKFGHISSDKY